MESLPLNQEVEQPKIHQKIVRTFQDYGIPVQLDDIDRVDMQHLPYVVTWWAKEFGIDKEKIGKEIFGSDWEEDKWL